MRTVSQDGPRSTLTLGLEVEFFAAIKRDIFQSIRHRSIASLLGTRFSQLRLYGPEGLGSAFKVVSDFEYDSIHERTVDYSCWNLTTDTTAGPGHPEWFSDCEEIDTLHLFLFILKLGRSINPANSR